MAADFIKEKKTRRLATKAVIAMGVVVLLVVGLNAGLTAAIVFLSRDTEVDSSGRIMVAGTDTPATIENPHITTRTLNTSLTVAGENRFLSEAPTAEVLVDAYGGAIAVAPLTNEANTLISACAKCTSNFQLPPAFTSCSRNVAPPSIYAPCLFSRAARSSALFSSLPPSLALSQTLLLSQHAPRTQPRAHAAACPSPHRRRTVRELHLRYLYRLTCGSRAWQDGGRGQDRKGQVYYSVRHQPVCGASRRQSQGPRLVLFSRHRLHARCNPHTFKRRHLSCSPRLERVGYFARVAHPRRRPQQCKRTHEVFDASCRVRAAVHPRLVATMHLSLLTLGATVSLGVSGWARRSIDSDVLYFADAEDEGDARSGDAGGGDAGITSRRNASSSNPCPINYTHVLATTQFIVRAPCVTRLPRFAQQPTARTT